MQMARTENICNTENVIFWKKNYRLPGGIKAAICESMIFLVSTRSKAAHLMPRQTTVNNRNKKIKQKQFV